MTPDRSLSSTRFYSALNLPDLLIFHSVPLSASAGVCQHTHVFLSRAAIGSAPGQMLPGCLLPYFTLLSPDAHRLIERCFQRMVLRARSMVAAPCQMQGGGGQKRQEARLWLLQTQLSQMEWMCSQVATVSSVYTICSCRSCWFCHCSTQRTRLSSRKT